MNKQEALAEAKRRWGKEGWAEFDPKAAANAVDRAQFRQEKEAKSATFKPFPKELDRNTRMRDPEYKKWFMEYKRPHDLEVLRLKSLAMSYRYSVGNYLYMPGFGNCKATEAQGDSFEECFAKIDAR